MEDHRHSIAEEAARHQPRLPKKLIVCCDGTWMDRDNGWQRGKKGEPGKVQNPSNVTRIARAIMSEDQAKHPQIVYYQAGIGTGLGLYDQILGGGTGMGLSEHIREAYAFLATNWSPEDKLSKPDSIFLIGFSRGAFTARSLGGFIAAVGILTRKAMPFFYECFRDWENAGNKDYQPAFFEAYSQAHPEEDIRENIPGMKPATSKDENAIDTYMQAYKRHLLSYGLTQETSIKCIGVWDTVGALGIPVNPFIQRTFGMPAFIRAYRWYDTGLSSLVENAFQALALDEHRFPFSPALWEQPKSGTTNLKQVWFAGAHSNVGGSFRDYGQANITLAWMMDQLSGNSRSPTIEFDPVDWIRFDDSYIDLCFRQTANYYSRLPGKLGEAYSTWAMGKVYNSNTFPQAITGARTRTPGRYHRTDVETGNYTSTLLQNTNEYIHSSVRARIDLAGREVEPSTRLQKFSRWAYRKLTVQSYLHSYRPQRRKGVLPASGGPLEGWKLIDGHDDHEEANMNIDMTPDGLTQIQWEYVGLKRFKLNPTENEIGKAGTTPAGAGAGAGVTSPLILKEDIFAENGYEERLLLHDKKIAEQIIFSNNRWQWFKRPKVERKVAKTY